MSGKYDRLDRNDTWEEDDLAETPHPLSSLKMLRTLVLRSENKQCKRDRRITFQPNLCTYK
tara:strand:+ start:489 stop:671 length:183 start_codon:yes stop_codon:yes gene_type:complete